LEKELTIGEIAQRAGVRTSAIRYYESIHLLPEPSRTSGRRVYDETIIERLLFIQAAQRLGFSLTEIHALLSGQHAQESLAECWQFLAQKKIVEVQEHIQQAQSLQLVLQQSLGCVCSNLEECMNCVTSYSNGL
jgi:MerR family redox-sensitive transcriptional activator SoxR